MVRFVKPDSVSVHVGNIFAGKSCYPDPQSYEALPQRCLNPELFSLPTPFSGRALPLIFDCTFHVVMCMSHAGKQSLQRSVISLKLFKRLNVPKAISIYFRFQTKHVGCFTARGKCHQPNSRLHTP